MSEPKPVYQNGHLTDLQRLQEEILLARRAALVQELRIVEAYLIQRGLISNPLCKPGPVDRLR